MISLLGAQGFIGSNYVAHLNLTNKKYQILTHHSPELFDQNCGTLIYFVGKTGNYLKNPFQTVHAHILFLAELLEKAHFDYFIYLSSTRLYDFIPEQIATEKTPLCFLTQEKSNLYHLSKAMGENLTLATANSSVLRLSNVYDFSNYPFGFLNQLLNQLKNKKEIILTSSPYFSRNYLLMQDLIDILDFFVENQPQGIFNIASPKNTSNLELKECLEKLGFSLQFTHYQKQNLPQIDISFLNKNNLTPSETIKNIKNYFLKG